jgi:hypothetical protein
MKNIFLRCACVAALAWGVPAGAGAQGLQLTMQEGRVTIVAENVPLRQVLQEWARVGQARIVNGEKLGGQTVTVHLVNAPERDALDILLRSASGYIAAPRAVPVANAAFYDRVTIMATSRAPAATASNMAPPTFQRPPAPVDDSDEPINVTMPPGAQGNPVVSPYPGMPPGQTTVPQAQPGAPAAPLTSPRPGAVQAPPNPAGVPSPYQPIRSPLPPGGRGGGPGLH